MRQLFIIILFVFATAIVNGQDAWTVKTPFGGTARWGAVAFSIGAKAYVGLGNDGTNRNDFWEWDQVTNAWTQKASFPGAGRYQAVAFSIGDKGYVGTGAAGLVFPFTPLYSDFWEYDPATDQWTQKTSFPGTARFGACGFSIGTKGYIGTGFDAVTFFQKDFWEYDPATDHWTQKTSFGGMNRMEAVGFSIGDKGYIGTGGNYSTGTLLLADFWEYDPTINHWTKKADFGGTGRSLGVGFSIGDKGYIGLGGNFASVAYSDFWAYNPTANQWTKTADFGGTPRWLATGFSIGDKGYVATGGNFSPTYKDLWEFNASPTGIDESHNQAIVTVFPNPADKMITIEMKQVNGFTAKMRVWNSLGEIVEYESLNRNLNTLDISNLKAGLYFYQVADGQKMISEGKLTILH